MPVKAKLRKKYIKIDNGCWMWIAATDKEGYGQYSRQEGEKVVRHRAQRFIYELYRGKIPAGLYLDHLCKNKGCVNPNHLEAVTPAENIRRAKSTKLNILKVKRIRNLYRNSGLLQREIGDLFGVGQWNISRIVNNKRWKEINNSAYS